MPFRRHAVGTRDGDRPDTRRLARLRKVEVDPGARDAIVGRLVNLDHSLGRRSQ